jgi:predicted small secreted protein
MIAVMLVVSVISLAGCNMMHGLGKDIEQVGEKMQKKSQ